MNSRIFLTVFLIATAFVSFAQKGTIKGKLTEDVNGTQQPLPFANVFLEGTTIGGTSDFDGNFQFQAPAGDYTLMCSFMGYETFKKPIQLTEGGELSVNIEMKTEGIALEGVKVEAKLNRESEMALIMEQKNADVIVESIGSKRLSSLGVSDAAGATTKISGVAQSEGSGDVYIRGLGDRYLSTTLNGLPVPSDDVEKKNIDLKLYPTDVIKNVGINKTYSVETYGDQASGNVNVSTKTQSNELTVGISTGVNTNVVASGEFGNFKATQNINDVNVGFYKQPYSTEEAITKQSWNTQTRKLPLPYGVSVSGGKQFNDLSIFATVSHSGSSEYQEGIYRKYRSNEENKVFTDATNYISKVNSTGLLSVGYKLAENHDINFTSLLVHKTKDDLYEAGRNLEGFAYDQLPKESQAFVRDQNMKETNMLVNQLHGNHTFGFRNTLKWAVGYSSVKSDEPNRIRNEVNIFEEEEYTRFSYVGNYQQRKSLQAIKDNELNGFVKNELKIIDEENKRLKLDFGANYRGKNRDFQSQFVGVRARNVRFSSIDNMDEALLDQAKYDNGDLLIDVALLDSYNANLNVMAGFASTSFSFNKFSGNLGVRYEVDNLTVAYDVKNILPRKNEVSYVYNNLFPAANFKFQVNDEHSLRLAASKTITLPEFKELAPFEYDSPGGDVTKGNQELLASTNYNFDIKYEFYPRPKEMVSLAGFYKQINDPINLTQMSGSSGYFKYENTGEKANVYGLEFESRIKLIRQTGEGIPQLNLVFNATRMWFKQDLLERYQYNLRTEDGLQGASEYIVNASLNYSTNTEKELTASLTANYSSDKIYALGAPEDFINSATLFNSEIIEKGFVSLDMVIGKKLSDRISLRFSAKNLLNPSIERTQKVFEEIEYDKDTHQITHEVSSEQIVKSYKKGLGLSLGVKINLN